MSDTPRTDAAEAIDDWDSERSERLLAFARQLEREITQWEQRAYGAEDEVKTLLDASMNEAPIGWAIYDGAANGALLDVVVVKPPLHPDHRHEPLALQRDRDEWRATAYRLAEQERPRDALMRELKNGPSTGESPTVSRQHGEGPPNAAPQVPVDRKSGQQQDVNTSLPADAAPHRWDADGEMCERCGEKDWFAGPVCKGPM